MYICGVQINEFANLPKEQFIAVAERLCRELMVPPSDAATLTVVSVLHDIYDAGRCRGVVEAPD